MEVVGNSIRHIEKAPPLARKPSGRLPRQRRSVNSVLTASVRRGGRFLGRGVVQGAGVVVHGAGAFSAAAWRIEQMLSQRTSGLKDDMLIQALQTFASPRPLLPRLIASHRPQLLRASLPLVRKALNRQIFVMFHKKIALPLGQSRENPSGTPPYELCIDKLHGIDKLPLLDTIVSSLTIQAHPPFLIEGVDVVGSSWRPQIRSHHSSDIRQADNSHPSSANPPPASRGKLWGGTASEGGEEGGMEKAAHADGEDAVIDFRVARAKVEMVIDPNTTSFVLRGRRCWTPSFRLACKRLDIVTPASVDSQDMPVASYEDVHALFALINEEPEEDFPLARPRALIQLLASPKRSVREIKQLLSAGGVDYSGVLEKEELLRLLNAMPPQLASPPAISLPIVFMQGGAYVVVDSPWGELRLLLDSGASSSILSSPASQKILSPSSGVGEGENSPLPGSRVELHSVSQPSLCLSLRVASPSQMLPPGVDGIVGIETLRAFAAAEINWDTSTLWLHYCQRDRREAANPVLLPFRMRPVAAGSLPFVRASFNGCEVEGLVDTGSPVTMATPELGDAARMQPCGEAGEDVITTGVDGRPVRMRAALVSYVQMGGSTGALAA
ncbi:MAG: hypothetical protein SGPRY_000029 [Prymnesium sp.]